MPTLFNYVQLVSKPTVVSSGSLLDHVYVKRSKMNKVEANVVSVYYSDHEAVKLTVKFKKSFIKICNSVFKTVTVKPSQNTTELSIKLQKR